MDEFIARVSKQLKVEEGVKLKPYLDSKGILTAGVGRNLNVGFRPDEVDLMLANDIKERIEFLGQYAWYSSQSDVRRAAILDMSFMGPEKLLHFVNMIHYLTVDDYPNAAAEAKNSQWYKDVGPTRGDRIANMLLTGAWPQDIPYP